MEENVDTIIAKYGQKSPKRSGKSRAIILIVIIFVVIGLAVCALIVFMNKQTMKTTTAQTPVTQVFNGPSAKNIVDHIAADPTVSGSKNYFVSRTNAAQSDPSSDITSIVYQEGGYSFLTTATAEDGLRFTLSNTKSPSNKAAITAAVQTVLKSQGFTQVTQDTGALSSYKTDTYTNDGTVCQAVDYTGANQTNLEQSILCINHDGLEAAYKNVTSLLEKASSDLIALTKAVTKTSATDGTKTLLTLTVQPKAGTSTRYYFATLKTDYEYLGSQPTPSVDNESSYQLSAQLKKNISDPKWGTFLTDRIK